MQTPPGILTVSYQMPRDVIVRIWWRRMLFRPRILGSMTGMAIITAFCFMGHIGMEWAGLVILVLLVMTPINIYRVVAKAVDGNKQTTDPKTLTYTASRLFLTGPDWKSELPWTTFKGFSEDEMYFYLHLSDNGIASVLPKSAFTSEQQQKFREYATSRNPSDGKAPAKP